MRPGRFRIYVGVVLSCLVVGAWIDGDFNRHAARTPQSCADSLGIQWDVENGATERLAEFSACVGR